MSLIVRRICAGQRSYRNIFVKRIPIIDTLALPEVLGINMIESLIPSFETFCAQGYDFLAEPTPKATLPVATDPALLALFPYYFLILDRVAVSQMGLKLFPAIENLSTLVYPAASALLMTTPSLGLVMSSIFVPLPVIFAAKDLGAFRISATIGTSVALLVFPIFC